jgi:antitoxin CcdA
MRIIEPAISEVTTMAEALTQPHEGRKRSTNLTLRDSLVQEARTLEINLSEAAEDGIARAVAKVRSDQWVSRNRDAMASYNDFVAENGLILEDLQTF